MATELQKEYINDLAVKKVKEFKEFKELLVANDIVKADTDTANATTLAEITNRLTDKQAADLIDLLIARDEPYRDERYADKRVKTVIQTLENIKKTIDGWGFK